MTGRYAAETTVPADRSRAEIERTLTRYGATAFAYGWDGTGGAHVGFIADNRQVRLVVRLPDRAASEFTHSPAGRARTDRAAVAAWEQACRQAWRALSLVVKAKLEAVAAGISTFEAEFLAYIVLPDGSTMGEWAAPQVAAAYDTGRMPALLAIGPARH